MNDAASATGTWDRHAARYGAQERLELRAIDAAIRVAAVAADERLVDLATGTGLLLRRLLTSPSPPGEAVGIDRSPRMLEHAALWLAARSRPAAWGGLLALDPSAELVDAGFAITRRVVVARHGYPSLVVAAGPAFRSS